MRVVFLTNSFKNIFFEKIQVHRWTDWWLPEVGGMRGEASKIDTVKRHKCPVIKQPCHGDIMNSMGNIVNKLYCIFKSCLKSNLKRSYHKKQIVAVCGGYQLDLLWRSFCSVHMYCIVMLYTWNEYNIKSHKHSNIHNNSTKLCDAR